MERSTNQPRRCLLVTGGAGFIGSNFVRYWVQHYPNDQIVVLDALTYAGNRQNLVRHEHFGAPGNSGVINQAHDRIPRQVKFVEGSITNRALIENLLNTYGVDYLINFAAESHVDRSISHPDTFIQTNVVGTFTLLETFRQYWVEHQKSKQTNRMCFLQISTDEVYGSLAEAAPGFNEATRFAPSSPYSASKAGADHLVQAYGQTYGLPTIVTHCSNNYGPYQFPEKLIPLICQNIQQGLPLPIYGDGRNIRDWIYVDDHCRALDLIVNHGNFFASYNIGTNDEVRNIDLVMQLCQLMDELAGNLPVFPSLQLIKFVPDRLGHDWRYAIDATKLRTELGWHPQESLETGLRKTVQWYLNHAEWIAATGQPR